MAHGNESYEAVGQVIVLGRGLEHGQPTQATRDNAMAAAHFYETYGPDRVIFAGGHSSLADIMTLTAAGKSEAEFMADIADLPSGIAHVEGNSTSTLTNFIYGSSHLLPDTSVGVLTHRVHLGRALYIAKRVLATSAIGIPAEEFGATPIQDGALRERILLLKEAVSLGLVEAGDLDGLLARTAKLERIKTAFRPILGRLSGSIRQHN